MVNKPENNVVLPSLQPKLLIHPFQTLQKGYILRLALIHAKLCEGACLPILHLNENVPFDIFFTTCEFLPDRGNCGCKRNCVTSYVVLNVVSLGSPG